MAFLGHLLPEAILPSRAAAKRASPLLFFAARDRFPPSPNESTAGNPACTLPSEHSFS